MIAEIIQNNKLFLKFIGDELGWGVFTNSIIKNGEVVEYCHCILDNYVTSPLKDYIFSPKSDNFDVYHCLGFGAIYNHNSDPNIKWVFIENDGHPLFKFYALRDIQIGEELTHYYGNEYWKGTNYLGISRKNKKMI